MAVVATNVSKKWSHPAQKAQLLYSVGVIIGSFLSWVEPAGVSGFSGPGYYTFFAGVLGLGAGLIPIKTLAILQTAVMSLLTISLPVWQLSRFARMLAFGDWYPGVGLVLVLSSGILAALGARRMFLAS